jgi:hypothetical protein
MYSSRGFGCNGANAMLGSGSEVSTRVAGDFPYIEWHSLNQGFELLLDHKLHDMDPETTGA